MLTTRILPTLACAAIWLGAPVWALAADDGAKTFQESCAGCHPPSGLTLDDKHMSRAEWKENIDRMAEMNRLDPPLKKEQYDVLLDWLVATHGPVRSPSEPANVKK